MTKYSYRIIIPALALVLAACGKAEDVAPPPPEAPPIQTVLPNVPVPPEGVAISSESGADVTQLVFVTPVGVDSIIEHYRKTLAEAPFRLVSEQVVGASTVFLAEQDGPGLWVTIRSDSAGGSSVTIAGGATMKPKKDSTTS